MGEPVYATVEILLKSANLSRQYLVKPAGSGLLTKIPLPRIVMTHKSKWLLFAPAGLLAVGAGACLVSWSGDLKAKGAPAKQWVPAGTAALVVLNAGLSLFGHGVAESVLYQLREKDQPEPA